jgi:hypothetical protein
MHTENSDDFDRDPALTLQLRALLRPPTDAGYWDSLEERILSRVRADGMAGGRSITPSGAFAVIGGWWEPYAQWTRIGGLLATAVLVLTAWSFWRTSSTDARLDYEAAVEALSTPLDSTGRPFSDVPREKTVSDLFRY